MQAAHAAYEAARTFDRPDQPHPHFVVCGLPNEAALVQAQHRISPHVKHRPFYEEDIGNQLTAIATEPVEGEVRKLFRRYSLLKFSPEKP